MTFSCQPALVHSISFNYNACASFPFLISRHLRIKSGMSALFFTDLILFYVLSESIIFCFLFIRLQHGYFHFAAFFLKHACNMFSLQPDFKCMLNFYFAAVILICMCDPPGPPYQVTSKEEMTLTQNIKSK